MGFSEEFMKAMEEWTGQALPQPRRRLQVSLEPRSSEQQAPPRAHTLCLHLSLAPAWANG